MRVGWIAVLALGLAGSLWIALGVAWWRDRSHEWETPRWDPSRFTRVPVAASAAAEPAGRGPHGTPETWVIAVNLHCPHCVTRLNGLARDCSGDRDCAPLLALIVDSPRSPSPEQVRHLPVHQVWWDSREIWRKRWGHRAYGEVMRFGGDGRYRGLLP